MIDSQDVSKEELEVLKGDAVGNNLCSSKWIINTLMSLLKVDENGWTEELENQLCTLWDLSTEGEVVSYLLSQNFLQIAKYLLTICDEPRFIEIVLGIIGNVCCNDEAMDAVGCDQELIKQILSHLESSDSLILIQLIRILQLIAWKIRQNPQSNWVAHLTKCEFFGATIIFILKSSTNDNLLITTMNLLEFISQINLLKKLFKINDLIPALLESFAQVLPEGKTSLSELTFVQHWLAVLIVVMESGSLTFEDYENDERFLKLMDIIYRILKPYNKSYNLYSIQQQSANIIYDAMRVLLSFRRCNVNIPTRIDYIIAILIFSLKTVLEANEEKKMRELDPNELNDLLDYIIKYWLYIIESCTSEQIVAILDLCDNEVRECLISFAQSKMISEMLDKVKKVVTVFEKSKKDTF
ncbi:PREDICTED: protein saal1 [Atta cephalotes]|uniref:Protein SAAL1 n=1 Tax=Atta cephalotes TaxID=12957 RepID=A0A158NC25_ATTCE|nr:PREDICTED: protein saal1 [Atta cephalotes]